MGKPVTSYHKGIAHKLPDSREVEQGFNRVITSWREVVGRVGRGLI